jgi:hypothetical protein
MCMACEMEAVWFAAMEARARAAPQATALPPPLAGEGRGGGLRVGEGGGARGEASPLPNPPPEEGGGGKPPRFACEETQAE